MQVTFFFSKQLSLFVFHSLIYNLEPIYKDNLISIWLKMEASFLKRKCGNIKVKSYWIYIESSIYVATIKNHRSEIESIISKNFIFHLY